MTAAARRRSTQSHAELHRAIQSHTEPHEASPQSSTREIATLLQPIRVRTLEGHRVANPTDADPGRVRRGELLRGERRPIEAGVCEEGVVARVLQRGRGVIARGGGGSVRFGAEAARRVAVEELVVRAGVGVRVWAGVRMKGEG